MKCRMVDKYAIFQIQTCINGCEFDAQADFDKFFYYQEVEFKIEYSCY